MVNPKSRLGYMYGIGVRKDPYETPLKTGEEKFQSIVGEEGAYYAVGSRLPRKNQRMAMDILNLDITQSPGTPAAFPLPNIGGPELRTPELPQR
jgi:hypothetical protein